MHGYNSLCVTSYPRFLVCGPYFMYIDIIELMPFYVTSEHCWYIRQYHDLVMFNQFWSCWMCWCYDSVKCWILLISWFNSWLNLHTLWYFCSIVKFLHMMIHPWIYVLHNKCDTVFFNLVVQSFFFWNMVQSFMKVEFYSKMISREYNMYQ